MSTHAILCGSHSQLRVYGSADARGKFVQDFAAARVRVLNLDRFDLRRP